MPLTQTDLVRWQCHEAAEAFAQHQCLQILGYLSYPDAKKPKALSLTWESPGLMVAVDMPNVAVAMNVSPNFCHGWQPGPSS